MGCPGAGKTALLETARHHLCSLVLVLPESAGIVFGGGFPRHDSAAGLRASQRAIFHIQREMERLVSDEAQAAIALCDRGTLDALAYWPGEPTEFWEEVSSSVEAELDRYIALIHLEVPDATQGYERFSKSPPHRVQR
ncbi:MAG: AAA family ATPase [Acidimicrobiia bacterium]